jgi:GMP synthase (glutamine-hydrolysing)
MILVLDTIKNDDASFRFRKSIERILKDNYKYVFKRIYNNDLNLDYSQYNKLIISGSELSASSQHIEQKEVFSIMSDFIFAGKPVLGICYGHQMLARLLSGDHSCIPAKTPEFGFTKLEIEDNLLFKGITKAIFMQSHFDEVVDLDDSFKIIAKNDKVKIQAFQWQDFPVWGVQFHPELNYVEGSKMLERNLQEDTRVKEYANYDCEDDKSCDQAELVLLNFCNIGVE